MDYMTLKEASEKWGVSSRQVNYYCVEGRIPGAVMGRFVPSSQLLLRRGAYSRRCENGWCLVTPQGDE